MKEQLAWNNMIADDIDQLRNIIYRLENKILGLEAKLTALANATGDDNIRIQQLEARIEKLEAAERTTAKILNERSCDTCD